MAASGVTFARETKAPVGRATPAARSGAHTADDNGWFVDRFSIDNLRYRQTERGGVAEEKGDVRDASRGKPLPPPCPAECAVGA